MIARARSQLDDGSITLIDPPIADIESVAIQEVYRHWQERHHGDALPRREDLEPAGIVRRLPNIFLVDVLEDPVRYRYRLIGTQLVEWSGRDATGSFMDDPLCGQGGGTLVALHDDVVRLRQPVMTVNRPALFHGSTLLFDRLLLPLAGDDDRIAMIMGVADANAPQSV